MFPPAICEGHRFPTSLPVFVTICLLDDSLVGVKSYLAVVLICSSPRIGSSRRTSKSHKDIIRTASRNLGSPPTVPEPGESMWRGQNVAPDSHPSENTGGVKRRPNWEDRPPSHFFPTSPLGADYVQRTGLYEGLLGNDSYLNEEEGDIFNGDTRLTNNLKISKSMKVQCDSCILALPSLSSSRIYLQGASRG